MEEEVHKDSKHKIFPNLPIDVCFIWQYCSTCMVLLVKNCTFLRLQKLIHATKLCTGLSILLTQIIEINPAHLY